MLAMETLLAVQQVDRCGGTGYCAPRVRHVEESWLFLDTMRQLFWLVVWLIDLSLTIDCNALQAPHYRSQVRCTHVVVVQFHVGRIVMLFPGSQLCLDGLLVRGLRGSLLNCDANHNSDIIWFAAFPAFLGISLFDLLREGAFASSI